jgi:hypothetical protein
VFNNKQSIKSNKIKQQSQCLSNKSEHIFERERERERERGRDTNTRFGNDARASWGMQVRVDDTDVQWSR